MKRPSTLQLALLAGISFFTFSEANAQKAYIKIGGGYNFGIGSEIEYRSEEHTMHNNNGPSTGSIKYERVNINPGKGGVIGGAVGYMFNNNLGFELGVSYLAGKKNEIESKETNSYPNSPFAPPLITTTAKSSVQSQMILLQPSVVIASGLSKLNPYARVGMIAAKGNIKEAASISQSTGEDIEMEAKFYGGWGIGMQAALGVNFSLNEMITIYTEGTFNNLTYAPEKMEITLLKENGVDRLHTLETSDKEATFEDELSYSSSDQPSPSKPSTEMKQRYMLNSAGINLGLKISF